MTVRGALPAPAPQPSASIDAAVPTRTVFGVIVGGTLAGDVIVMSPKAMVLVRAGSFVKALIIWGLASLRRSVPLAGGRTLCLQDGVYQVR